jgi:hypothetical protein
MVGVEAEKIVAIGGPSNGWSFGDDYAGDHAPARRVLRFGTKVADTDVETVPERYRSPEGVEGRLVDVRLRPATGEVWLRTRVTDVFRPWKRTVRTIPLNGSQSPTPTPDAVELRGGMRVVCHEGSIGRLEGLAINAQAGIATDLLVHVRGDVLAEVETPASPMARLLDLAGRRVLLPPAWARSAKREHAGMPLNGGGEVLHLDASVEQVAAGQLLRPDGDVAADIWRMLEVNPALAPYTGHLRVDVRDGDVTLRGTLPSVRHRAAAEQDVWHVLGVFSVRNDIVIDG